MAVTSLFAPPPTHLVLLEASPAVHQWLREHPSTTIIHDQFPDDPVHLRLDPAPNEDGVYTIKSRLSWTYLNLYLTWWLRDISKATGEPIQRMVWKMLEVGKIGGGKE
jgi:hypothetical protein